MLALLMLLQVMGPPADDQPATPTAGCGRAADDEVVVCAEAVARPAGEEHDLLLLRAGSERGKGQGQENGGKDAQGSFHAGSPVLPRDHTGRDTRPPQRYHPSP